MNDVLEQREGSIEEYRKGISLDGARTGAAFFVNGIFQGIELFDREATFGKMFSKLLSAVAVEARKADRTVIITPERMGEMIGRMRIPVNLTSDSVSN